MAPSLALSYHQVRSQLPLFALQSADVRDRQGAAPSATFAAYVYLYVRRRGGGRPIKMRVVSHAACSSGGMFRIISANTL